MVFVFRWQDDNKMMFRRGRWTAVPAGDGRRRQRRFATMEAAEGRAAAAAPWMCLIFDLCVAAISPSFPYKPTVGIVTTW